MRPLARSGIAMLVLLSATLVPLHSIASTVYQRDDFKPAIDHAVGQLYQLHGGRDTEDSSGGTIAYEELEGLAAGGAWRIRLGIGCEMLGTQNSVSNEYNKLIKYNSDAAVGNNTDSFNYFFRTQAVDEVHLPKVEERIASRKATMQNALSDVTLSIDRDADSTYLVTAAYSYAGDVSAAQISERLLSLMQESEWLMCDIHTGVELSNADRWKDLKGPIETLSKADFITLYPVFKESGFEVNNPDNPYGDWQIGGDGYKVWVENHGSGMRLWTRIQQPYGNTPQDKGEAVLAQIRALAPPKGAAVLEAYWDANDIWVGSVYPYAGMKGKDIEDTVEYFFNKYAPHVTKDVGKIMKKTL